MWLAVVKVMSYALRRVGIKSDISISNNTLNKKERVKTIKTFSHLRVHGAFNLIIFRSLAVFLYNINICLSTPVSFAAAKELQ